MTLKLNGTNSEAAPAYAGDDADTGLQCGTNELKLVTGGTARATVDSSGNLGIGTTSPDVKLDIQANGSDNYPAIELLNSTGTGSSIRSKKSLVLEADYDNNSAGSQSTILFTTDGSERMRILANGGLTFNGDTAAANALDDYEEGAFTPTLGGFTNAGIFQTAQYVKIGRLVNVFINIYQSSNNMSFTNSSSISGLPFTTITDFHTSINAEALTVTGAMQQISAYLAPTTPVIEIKTASDSSNKRHLLIHASYYANA